MKLNESNLSSLYVNQIFKSFNELYFTVTGKKFGGGKGNKESAEKEFCRHFNYDLLRNIDPNEKSKRKLIILEIYDTPLAYKENRGRRGSYSDFLRPLILMQSNFSGKIHRFYNKAGVIDRYVRHLRENSNVFDHLNWVDSYEYNPWKILEGDTSAVSEYKRNFFYQERKIFIENLNALQKAGLLKWNYYHMLIPSATLDIEGTKYSRAKENVAIYTDLLKMERLWAKIREDKNCAITHETLTCLNIFTNGWRNTLHHDNYISLLALEKVKRHSVRASKQQEEAIHNLEIFMKQLTIEKCKKMEHLPPIDEIPNDYKFFTNPYYRETYYTLEKDYYPWLISCDVIWREVSYQVTGTDEEINEYLGYDLKTADKKSLADNLSNALIKYMGTHMSKFTFTAPNYDDLVPPAFGRIAIINPTPLRRSVSATNLHKSLKGLYAV